jgi:hypothetical protein
VCERDTRSFELVGGRPPPPADPDPSTTYLQEWVQAVNSQGGFGRWSSDVSFEPGDVLDILERHASGSAV